MESPRKPRSVPPVYFLSGLILIPLTTYLTPCLSVVPFPFNRAGMPLLLRGAYLSNHAYGLFLRHETAHDFEVTPLLVQEGPFRYTRNPMYLGMVSALLGLVVCLGNQAAMGPTLVVFGGMHAVCVP